MPIGGLAEGNYLNKSFTANPLHLIWWGVLQASRDFIAPRDNGSNGFYDGKLVLVHR